MGSGRWIEPNPRFRGDGHCWVYTQGGRTSTCTGLVAVLVPVWLSLFTVQPAVQRKWDSRPEMTCRADQPGRHKEQRDSSWIKSLDEIIQKHQSVCAHARHAHAPRRACKSLLIAMWNHLHLIIPAHLHGNARGSMSNLLLIPWIMTVNRGFPVRFEVCYIHTGLGRIFFPQSYLLGW